MESISRTKRFAIFVGATLFLYPLTRPIFAPHHKSRPKKINRTVVVTGASGNVGAQLSRYFAAKQYRVIMACRDMDKCKSVRRQVVLETANRSIACRQVDLEDIDSINRFADEISKDEPHIDILINNAAVKKVPTRELTKYGVEKNYFVNFVAPFLLTLRLLPKLEESAEITKDSRVVNVTGWIRKGYDVDLGDINFDSRRYSSKTAYRQSKLALAYFTILLDDFNREKKNNVYVFGADPVYRRISASLFRPTNLPENFIERLQGYWFCNPEYAIGNIVRGAVEDSKDSGKLYSLFGLVWNWKSKGPIANRVKAEYVWNTAAEILLTSNSTTSNNNNIDKSIAANGSVIVNNSNPTPEDNQEKLQGNNNVGSADVSVTEPGKVSA